MAGAKTRTFPTKPARGGKPARLNMKKPIASFVAGATAVQVGTANFYRPTASIEILDALPSALAELGAGCVDDVVGTLKTDE